MLFSWKPYNIAKAVCLGSTAASNRVALMVSSAEWRGWAWIIIANAELFKRLSRSSKLLLSYNVEQNNPAIGSLSFFSNTLMNSWDKEVQQVKLHLKTSTTVYIVSKLIQSDISLHCLKHTILNESSKVWHILSLRCHLDLQKWSAAAMAATRAAASQPIITQAHSHCRTAGKHTWQKTSEPIKPK